MELALRSNLAACHLKNGNFDEAISQCQLVLEKQPDNSKANYRIAQGMLALYEEDTLEFELLQGALQHSEQALIAAPNDTTIREFYDKVRGFVESKAKEEAGIYGEGGKGGKRPAGKEMH